LLDRVRDRFARRASVIRRQIDIEAPSELELVADPLRLEQAVGNLVENALRHGAGEITLVAEDRGEQVRLHVRDHGPGFSWTFLPQAFQRFSRADSGRAAGGAGLGLAIVLAIAQAHGGSCGAGNREDGGADVWIELPMGSWSSHQAAVDKGVSLRQ
jgi:signal transduction histidine kinase